MKVYIICSVRAGTPAEVKDYVDALEATGAVVHYPPRDVPQDCPTGEAICVAHKAAMLACDEVHVFWDVDSKGSHFDLGMAYVLGKRIVPVACVQPDGAGKSYWKVMQKCV